MRMQIIVGIRAFLVITVFTGLLFPLVMTGVAQVAFHDKANGSLVERDGHVVGSTLIGQSFTGNQYFHPRPSAAAAGASGSMIDDADADGQPTGESSPADPKDLSLTPSGASNLGPINDVLLSTVADRVAAYRSDNGLDSTAPVPVDAVTTSASGLDPHISVANARLQAPRVAAVRGLALAVVLALVAEHTTGSVLGVLGDKGVNVLALNLALDDHQAQR
jgi:potassium-transporting ATPase KdpC subunit